MLNTLAWVGFDHWTRARSDNDGDPVNHWDDYARYTVVELRFDSEDVTQSVPWVINTGWMFVTLTDKNPDFMGFLVDKEDCVELPF